MDLLDKLKIPAIIKKREETFHITERIANSQRYELDVDVSSIQHGCFQVFNMETISEGIPELGIKDVSFKIC